MSIPLKQNPFELLRIDDDDDDDDDVASVKESIPAALEPVEPTRKPKRKKKRKRIISSILNTESTAAASKNPEKQDGQIASVDGSPAPTDTGREDDPGTHVHNIVLTASFRSSPSSYLLSWHSSVSSIPGPTNNLGKRKGRSAPGSFSTTHGSSNHCRREG